MNLNLQIVGLLFIFIILISIIYILRKGRMAIKYALVWLFAGLVLFIYLLFPGIMDATSKLLGFEVGSNMIFAGLIAMLIFINIALTVIVSGQNEKIRLLIQEVSIIKGELNNNK